ncbi:uncharacterized protein LOC125227546 [Leguminivora glycinivorella]|uniref:uncharacterized protein LOC125227546 n=1 Tax=Leguminivora glycinivorella TaxID=1035111 RepID=UPI00200E8BF9|nr:uncharacterized protein LOC125227546 [Leguminivora glycinivorella]
MSPARLLLALAALLAAARAQQNCKSVLFGITTSIPIISEAVQFPAGGGRVTIDDWCLQQLKGVARGNYVTACNSDQNGLAPDVYLVYANTISPVDVKCPDGCPRGGYVSVVQYCG